MLEPSLESKKTTGQMTKERGYAPGKRKSPANPYGFQLTVSRWATLEIRVVTEM